MASILSQLSRGGVLARLSRPCRSTLVQAAMSSGHVDATASVKAELFPCSSVWRPRDWESECTAHRATCGREANHCMWKEGATVACGSCWHWIVLLAYNMGKRGRDQTPKSCLQRLNKEHWTKTVRPGCNRYNPPATVIMESCSPALWISKRRMT